MRRHLIKKLPEEEINDTFLCLDKVTDSNKECDSIGAVRCMIMPTLSWEIDNEVNGANVG